jgi:hypothetical protein
MHDGDVIELSYEEGRKHIEEEARFRLDMSLDEFIEKWYFGYFGDPDDSLDALHVAMLLPFIGKETWKRG